MIKQKINIILIISLLFSSCEEDSIFKYINKPDSLTEITIDLPKVNRLIVYDDINVQLVPDTINKLTIKTNEILIDKITYKTKGDTLILQNENPYNFTSYDEFVQTQLHITKSFNRIETNGTGIINCSDTIKNESLTLYAYLNAGEFNLVVNTKHLSIPCHTYATTDYTIKGFTENLSTASLGIGKFNLLDLKTNNANIWHYGINDLYINVKNNLSVKIWNVGNVYYKGNPKITSTETTSKGKLIHID